MSENDNKKFCPFNKVACSDACMLYIAQEELNENVYTRLRSIGVISGDGACALKCMALSGIRKMYETTSVKRF